MKSTNSLKVISDSLNVVAQQAGLSESNSWIWIAIVSTSVILLLVVILLVHRRTKTKTKPVDNLDILKQQVREQGNVDFSNLINSAFNSKQLYDKLKVKCHPDRFPLDDEKNAIANDIFQRIKQNEHNVDELNKLKEEAEEKLGVII